MKYKGIELTEFKSNKNIAFNPIKKMLVWDSDDYIHQYPVLLYAGGIKDRLKVLTIDPNDGTIVRFAYCADIPKPQTNWDTFQQRYGTKKIDVNDAITKFIYSHMCCDFCPAKQQCSNLHTGDLAACVDTFKAWAETEAKDETARSV